MQVNIHAFSNCSNIYLVWEFAKRIPNCTGFAILRQNEGADDSSAVPLMSSVGFSDEPHPLQSGPKPSTERPFQRCTWNDWTAPRETKLVYKVRAVYEGDGPVVESEWSNPVILTDTQVGESTEAFFNDGVIATQWVARELKDHRSMEFERLIQTKDNPIRKRLGGRILSRLTSLLADAKAKRQHVYAALFELNDEELEGALVDLGARAHVVLANGSPQKDKETHEVDIDPNSDARTLLKSHHVDVHDRIFETATGGITSHLGHNKFAVFCDSHDEPLMVWSGSTNWTWSGLCTQTNNGVLITDKEVASVFLKQWKVLAAAGAKYPPAPKQSALAKPLQIATKNGKATVHVAFPAFTGKKGSITDSQPADLAYCAKLIERAKSGILFLMFIPGPTGTLMETIQALNSEKGKDKLFVRGVAQQDPGPKSKVPSIALAHRGELVPAPFDIVYPEAVSADMSWWIRELKKLPKTNAIIHSKLVVIDPFGDHPVVITGSHNLGTKASFQNDENLLIIENDRELAIQYAVNVVTIFNQYWWRFQRLPHPKKTAPAAHDDEFHALSAPAPDQLWKGLERNDHWQTKFLPGGEVRHELDFWLGA